jgi:hypothetical protein
MTDVTPTPKKKATRFITPALALVAAIGVGVVVGVVVGQNTATSAAPTGFNQGQLPDGAQGGTFPGGGFTAGTITGIDGDTVTIELQDGSTVTVTATDDTTVTTTTESSVSDLAEGDTITVSGDTDDDGNVASATSIREGEAMGGFGGANGVPPATN